MIVNLWCTYVTAAKEIADAITIDYKGKIIKVTLCDPDGKGADGGALEDEISESKSSTCFNVVRSQLYSFAQTKYWNLFQT